jgi:hypothetical protein
MCASALCWRAACFQRGGTRPPRLFPKRETGKGVQFLAPQANSPGWLLIPNATVKCLTLTMNAKPLGL